MDVTKDNKRCNNSNVVPNMGSILNDSDLLSHMFSQPCFQVDKVGLTHFRDELKELKAIGPENSKGRAHLGSSEAGPL